MIMNARLTTPLAFVLQAIAWSPALAQNSLTVPLEAVRISNPDLAPESRGSVTLFRLHPQYTLRTTQGASSTELSLGALVERSGNTDLSANRSLPSVRVLWENESPVAVFGLRASLEEASTRETEFADFGRVTLDSKERTGAVGGTWTYNLTAGTALEVDLSHARVTYDTPLLVNHRETSGSIAYRISASSNARYSLTAGASRLTPDGDRVRESRSELGFGYERDLSEGLVLNAAAGAVRTNTVRGKTAPVGALRLTYTGERIGYAVAWSREVSADGVVAGYTRSQVFDASATYPLTINTSFSLGLSHAQSLDGDRDTGSMVYARIQSEITRFWAVSMSLEQRRARPSGGPTAKGHSVAIGLVYSHPDF